MSQQVTPKGSLLFLSKNAKAASTRYRIFQFIPYLQQQGWHCDYRAVNKAGPLSRLRLLREARRCDIVVIQRKLFGPLFLPLLRAVAKFLVFDYDDAIFLNDDGSPSKRRLRRFRRVTRMADLVLAGNRYLAGFSQCARTEVLPTAVVFGRYAAQAPQQTAQKDLLTLAWIGSRSTMKYLQQHRTLFETIGKHFSSVQLKIIADFELQFEHLTTICIPWSEQRELQELRSADVGIAPMTDDPWTRGKCALKVIQYMACGLPVISSHCGANAEIVQTGKTGMLCDTATDWLNAIAALQDAAVRAEMGKQARHIVQRQFSVEALSERMDALFTQTFLTKTVAN